MRSRHQRVRKKSLCNILSGYVTVYALRGKVVLFSKAPLFYNPPEARRVSEANPLLTYSLSSESPECKLRLRAVTQSTGEINGGFIRRENYPYPILYIRVTAA